MLKRCVFAVVSVALLSGCRPAHRAPTEIVIMQSEAPRSMDPADHTATYTTAVLNPMYEGLTRFNQQLQLTPALATEWHSSADGMLWTFKLRSNVRFHDGSPFNAAAVVSSFQRMLDVKRGLAGSTSIRRSVESVRALDQSTVVFRLNAPFATFPNLLATTSIVSPKADHDGYLSRHAVGTGPYRFAEWKTGEYVREVRNEDYWGRKLRPTELRWMWTTEPALMNMAILAGEVDLVNPLPAIFADALQHDRKIRLMQRVSAAVFWVALNTKYKPLSDVRVRRALNYATDRVNLVRSQLRGYGQPANSSLAPAVANYAADTKGYSYDPEKARALLTAAGYADGFQLNIAVQESQVNFAEALQGMWAQVHVSLAIQQLETGVFSQTIFGSPEQKAATRTDSVFASWSSPTLDAERQLGPLFRTKSWSPAGANLGFYSNPKLDKLLDLATAELDLQKQKALYQEAQQILSDDAPDVALYYALDLAATRGDLSDLWLFPGGQIELAYEATP
jgi:glutathione transport system substrate-binding protein